MCLMSLRRKGDDTALEIEQVEAAVADESGQGQVAGEGVSREAPDDDLFVRRRHGLESFRGGADSPRGIVARLSRTAAKKLRET